MHFSSRKSSPTSLVKTRNAICEQYAHARRLTIRFVKVAKSCKRALADNTGKNRQSSFVAAQFLESRKTNPPEKYTNKIEFSPYHLGAYLGACLKIIPIKCIYNRYL